MGILKQQVCEIEAIVNHCVKKRSSTLSNPLISRLDGLQLAANQPGLEVFKANSPTPLWEGRGWKAEKRGLVKTKTLQSHVESDGEVYQPKWTQHSRNDFVSLLLLNAPFRGNSLIQWLISYLDDLREESPPSVLLRFVTLPWGVLNERQITGYFILWSR